MNSLRSRIWHKLCEERGANQLVMLMVSLGALLLVPLIFDLTSVRYARQGAQTAADAAVTAAAKDYAQPLSIRWVGFCAEPPPSVVGRYKAYVDGIQWAPLGYGAAHGYASANRARLTSYRNYQNGRFKIVDTIPLPYLEIRGSSEKTVHTVVEYGQQFEAPAKATSAVVLDRWDHWVFPCSIAGEPDVFHVYRFYWKIKLVR